MIYLVNCLRFLMLRDVLAKWAIHHLSLEYATINYRLLWIIYVDLPGKKMLFLSSWCLIIQLCLTTGGYVHWIGWKMCRENWFAFPILGWMGHNHTITKYIYIYTCIGQRRGQKKGVWINYWLTGMHIHGICCKIYKKQCFFVSHQNQCKIWEPNSEKEPPFIFLTFFCLCVGWRANLPQTILQETMFMLTCSVVQVYHQHMLYVHHTCSDLEPSIKHALFIVIRSTLFLGIIPFTLSLFYMMHGKRCEVTWDNPRKHSLMLYPRKPGKKKNTY